jgi:hypothetical protein
VNFEFSCYEICDSLWMRETKEVGRTDGGLVQCAAIIVVNRKYKCVRKRSSGC